MIKTVICFLFFQEFDGYYDKCIENVFQFLLIIQR